jgi:hypothetical protein
MMIVAPTTGDASVYFWELADLDDEGNPIEHSGKAVLTRMRPMHARAQGFAVIRGSRNNGSATAENISGKITVRTGRGEFGVTRFVPGSEPFLMIPAQIQILRDQGLLLQVNAVVSIPICICSVMTHISIPSSPAITEVAAPLNSPSLGN